MFVKIDGGQGEGGGQVLRTSLSLSMVTGKPFQIDNIRAGRQRPGLLRQHLTAVEAAAAISNATVDGASLGSTRLTFTPGAIRGGEYHFADEGEFRGGIDDGPASGGDHQTGRLAADVEAP